MLSVFLIIFTLFLYPCSTFTHTGYYILDLETTTLADEIGPWTLSLAVSSARTYTAPALRTLASQVVLGGPSILGDSGGNTNGQYFERTYTGISVPHTFVSFTIAVWYFGDYNGWDGTAPFKIEIDGTQMTGPGLHWFHGSWVYEGTGSVPNLGYDYVKGGIAHSSQSLTFRIFSLTAGTSATRSFGFRDLSFVFSSYSGSAPTLCHYFVPMSFYSGHNFYNPCTCTTSLYQAGSPCANCATGCSICFGSSANQCMKCNDDSNWNGNQCCYSSCETCNGATESDCLTCKSATPFMYANGTCLATCPLPLTSTYMSPTYYCNNPCNPSTQFLFTNGTCVNTCPSPLLSRTEPGVKYCWNPCGSTSQFLYPNGTCLNSCPSPLLQRTEDEVKYCWNPCDPSTQFLFTNSSCVSTCPTPLLSRTEPAAKFCWNPCDSTSEFLYPNGTCYSTCLSPLLQRTEPEVKFCWSPCDPTTEFLYPNLTCFSNCLSPLLSRAESIAQFCWNPCDPTTEYLFTNGTCLATCPSPLSSRTEPGVQFCWNSCGATSSNFLFPNQSCLATCPSPLLSRIEPSVNFCWNPCDSSTEFLFTNSSCMSTCPSPLSSRTEPGTKFCWNPCGETSSDYLFANLSCLATCPSPLLQRTEPQVNFCWNPCNPTTEFLFTNGSCLSSCPSPLLSRTESGVNYCWNPCDPTTEFLFTNGTCLTTCPSPLSSRTEPEVQYCWNPCGDTSTDYLYQNQSCFATCPSPLLQRSEPGVEFCWNPCDKSSEFLFTNSSCFNNCPSPLSIRTEPEVQYCFNPCDSSTQYLFTNGTCLTSCPLPLMNRTEPDAKYCFNPCGPTQYLYTNGTCLNSCQFPLSSRIEPHVQYCFKPCSQDDLFFYPKNSSCLISCPSPYVINITRGVSQCVSPCPHTSDYFIEAEKTCKTSCVSPNEFRIFDNAIKICFLVIQLSEEEVKTIESTVKSIAQQGAVTSQGMKAGAALNSGSPAAALLAGLSSMFSFIRYMDINYPPKLQLLFNVTDANPISFSFDFNVPDAVNKTLIDYPLADVFEKYKIHSNFIYNMWDSILSLLLVLGVILLLSLLQKATKKCPKLNTFITRVLQVLKWNIPIMMLCSSCGDIIFYSSLQFQSAPIDSFTSFLCLAVGILMIGLVVYIIYTVYKIVKDFRKQRVKSPDGDVPQEISLKDKWGDCEILYAEYHQNSPLSVGYMGLFILRTILFNLILSSLYKFPLAQASIINIFNLAMAGYLLYFKPMRDCIGFVQLLINELFVNIVCLCVFILAVMDHAGISGQKTRVGVGNVIIQIIKIFNSLGLAFMALSVLLYMRFFTRGLRYAYYKGVRSPIKLIKVAIFGEGEAESTKVHVITTEKVKELEEVKTEDVSKVDIVDTERGRIKSITSERDTSELYYIPNPRRDLRYKRNSSGAFDSPTQDNSPTMRPNLDSSNVDMSISMSHRELIPSNKDKSLEKRYNPYLPKTRWDLTNERNSSVLISSPTQIPTLENSPTLRSNLDSSNADMSISMSHRELLPSKQDKSLEKERNPYIPIWHERNSSVDISAFDSPLQENSPTLRPNMDNSNMDLSFSNDLSPSDQGQSMYYIRNPYLPSQRFDRKNERNASVHITQFGKMDNSNMDMSVDMSQRDSIPNNENNQDSYRVLNLKAVPMSLRSRKRRIKYEEGISTIFE